MSHSWSGEFSRLSAVFRRLPTQAYLNSWIVFVAAQETQVVSFRSHGEEAKSRFVGDEFQARACIGPSAADGFSHSAMISRELTRCWAMVAQFVEAPGICERMVLRKCFPSKNPVASP